ncbi:TPA: hypothetical protein HA265_05020, partial [Candidatus Woesearchaeota archaeon]|nr:hypothetical protein [Candidatus Woesearchaeota archaeon]
MKRHHIVWICILVVLVFASFVSAVDTPVQTADIKSQGFSPLVGPQHFDWFIKDPPPTGPPDFRVRTTGYYFAVESEYPKWYDASKKRSISFYHDVKMQGSAFTKDGKVIWYNKIQPTREASEKYFVDIDYFLAGKGTTYRPRRSIARNWIAGTPCYIPKYSRVYIKWPQENHPFTGWYIAEDTGGAFKGKCKIDIFM